MPANPPLSTSLATLFTADVPAFGATVVSHVEALEAIAEAARRLTVARASMAGTPGMSSMEQRRAWDTGHGDAERAIGEIAVAVADYDRLRAAE